MRTTLVLAIALWGAALGAQPRSAPDPLPRMRFRAHSAARYTARSAQIATVRGAPSRTETRLSFTLETGAVNAEGEATRTLRVTQASLSAESLPREVRARIQRTLGAALVVYIMDARGAVRARDVEGDQDPSTRALLHTLLGSFDAYTPVLPEGTTGVGARWTQTRQVTSSPVPGMRVSMRCETAYTLREQRPDGVMVLDLRVTLRTAEGALLAGVPFRGEGSGTGEVVLDLAAGLLRETRVRGDFTTRLTVRGQEVVLPSRFEDEVRLEGPRPR